MDLSWFRDRSLTLTMLGFFAVFFVGQLVTGWQEFNQEQIDHGARVIAFSSYLFTGHPWEALFENWESEFLQMAVFVTFTALLYQKGSPESRTPGAMELADADPRDFADRPDVPWPVKRGGWILSWSGHALGGYAAYRSDQAMHGQHVDSIADYVTSTRFWFESFQNWQSEFLSVGVMVWLAVYLRQRGSPESKPVHAPHDETGR
jgi:hypothetical protein